MTDELNVLTHSPVPIRGDLLGLLDDKYSESLLFTEPARVFHPIPYDFGIFAMSESVHSPVPLLERMVKWGYDVTIGELAFVAARFPKEIYTPVQQQMQSVEYFCMMVDSNRRLCEPYSALAWAIVSTLYGYEWAEGNPADALALSRGLGLSFDDIIPFVEVGVMDISAIARALDEGIDPELMSRIVVGER